MCTRELSQIDRAHVLLAVDCSTARIPPSKRGGPATASGHVADAYLPLLQCASIVHCTFPLNLDFVPPAPTLQVGHTTHSDQQHVASSVTFCRPHLSGHPDAISFFHLSSLVPTWVLILRLRRRAPNPSRPLHLPRNQPR